MATRRETFPIQVGGGLITNMSPIQQGMNAVGSARSLTNFEPSIKGGYRRINGYTKWDSNIVPTVSSSSQVLGVGFFDGEVISAREGKVFSSTGSGWTEIATGRTQTTKQRFHKFNLDGTRKIMGLDGSNYPYTWDGTTFTNVNGTTDVLGASFAVDFKDHMFYSNGDLVTYSVPFDETDFTTASGSGNFRMPGDVTGMIVFRERLFIFTEEEIKVLDGTSSADWALTSVSTDVGCIAKDTVKEVAGDVAFMAADGIRLLGATSRIGDFSNSITSKAIQNDIREFKDFYSQFESVVVREKSQYRVLGWLSGRDSDSTAGYLATQFEAQNPDSFQWAKTEGFKVYGADSAVYGGTEYIVFCSDTEYVYQMESGDDFDGTAIPANYFTPYFSFNDPTLRKTLYKKFMYFDPEGDVNGSLSVNFDFDDSLKIQPPSVTFAADGGGVVFGSGVFDTSTFVNAPSSYITCLLHGTGFTASLEFNFSTANDPFIIDTILLEFSTEDRR